MLAKLIRAEMDRRGLNQSQTATELGIPQSILSRWLNEQMQPSAERCPRVATFLGLRREDVMQMAGHWEEESDGPGEPRDAELEVHLHVVREALLQVDRRRWPRLAMAVRELALAFTAATGILAYKGSVARGLLVGGAM